jgi:hypothetical protein
MAVTIAGVPPSGRCPTHTCQRAFGFEEITASLSLPSPYIECPHLIAKALSTSFERYSGGVDLYRDQLI